MATGGCLGGHVATPGRPVATACDGAVRAKMSLKRLPFNMVDLTRFKVYPLPEGNVFSYLLLFMDVALMSDVSEEPRMERNSWQQR